MKNIASALVKAQKTFQPALKDATNPFYKSKYADLGNCLEAVMDSLNNNGISLVQLCHESDTGVIVETMFIHESGEQLSCGKLHVPAIKQDPQQYGSALTYARRYSLMAACGIAPEDDDGNAAKVKVVAPTSLTNNEMDEALKVMGVQSSLPNLKNAYEIYYHKANDEQKLIIAKRKDEIKSLIATLPKE